MTGDQRREQLIDVGRVLFAERGLDGASVEEVAARAEVSKPVVYGHFGGKNGLYAVVVEREERLLLERLSAALSTGSPRQLLEQACVALLAYVEERPAGFHLLARESSVASGPGAGATLLSDVASQVEHILAEAFSVRGLDPDVAGLYSQALVGMVALAGQWWQDRRTPSRDVVAAHLVDLAWNGLSGLQAEPALRRP